MKVTEWFPPKIKPLADRPGRYEVKCPSGDKNCTHHYWDGKVWWPRKGALFPYPSVTWRGRAK
jgi:hypothetical protein